MMTMKTAGTTPPVTANLSVKLPIHYRDRLQAIAKSENRSTHFLMKEAIRDYLEKKETEQRFIEVAKASRVHYQATGQHITAEEFGAWVDGLDVSGRSPVPPCHD